MKLTPEQIDHLYQFTRQHYVEYYDLQTELVDHLANAIEEQWKENPNVSFETALNIEFKKFGVMGFTDLIEKRKIALREKYDEIVRGYFKEFFKLPMLILALGVVLLCTIYVTEKQLDKLAPYLLIGFLVFYIFTWITRLIKKYVIRKKDDKKWLFEEVLQKHMPKSYFMYFFVFSFCTKHLEDKIPFEIPLFVHSLMNSLFLVYLLLYIYVVKIVIPLKTKDYLKQTYPEYELK